MSDRHLHEQAEQIASLLPRLMRQCFTLADDDPAMELPGAQLRVCSILRGGPQTMSALSRELGISLSAITQIADRLERTGIAERVAETEDRRVRSLQLTAHGMLVMGDRHERRVRRVQDLLSRMPSDARDGAIRALQALLDAGRSAAPPEDPAAASPSSRAPFAR